MADPFELILGGGLSDADKQKMIASALRNRRQLGDVSMLTGDQKLGQFGSSLAQDVQATEGRALSTQSSEAQRALTQDYYDQQAGNSALSQAMALRRAGETERHNRATEAARGVATDKNRDTNVRRLSESMTRAAIPELKNDLATLQSTISGFGEGDIPGVGYTGAFPTMMLSDKGADMRQKLATVRNKLLKMRSGAAVTDPEMNRLIEELGSMNDRDLVLAIPKIIQGVEAVEEGILAGYDQDVVDTYSGRIGGGRGAPPGEQQGEPEEDDEDEVYNWSDL